MMSQQYSDFVIGVPEDSTNHAEIRVQIPSWELVNGKWLLTQGKKAVSNDDCETTGLV